MTASASAGAAFTVWVVMLTMAAGATPRAAGQPPAAPDRSGRELYDLSCAACHGKDGRGTAPQRLGFDTPVPDFTDCEFATVEPDADWLAVAHQGGPARAFNRRMPAFGQALTDRELRRIVAYMRGFCTNPAWPRGELNLPRALVTEKAFPENEAVLTTTIGATGDRRVGNEFLYEQRLGPRSQFEIAVPLLMQEGATGGWRRGLGDAAVAIKHALYHDVARGHIFSIAGEVVLPTGKEADGLGAGTTVFEPFVAFGQILPGDSFVHAQAGVELPAHSDRAEREAFWRGAFGRSFTEGRFGRAWSPMIELLAARELERGAATEWDVVPQMQVTLSRRQHIMIDVGVRLPINERAGRHPQVITYFLWDWFDGGLREGW